MKDLTNKQSGLLFGSYCADALSLGVHWIYDPNELAQKHGRITYYKAPGPDSYHPHKQAGGLEAVRRFVLDFGICPNNVRGRLCVPIL